nr:MAG TPA: hypothetical protein [Caudoviricetes sp.]
MMGKSNNNANLVIGLMSLGGIVLSSVSTSKASTAEKKATEAERAMGVMRKRQEEILNEMKTHINLGNQMVGAASELSNDVKNLDERLQDVEFAISLESKEDDSEKVPELMDVAKNLKEIQEALTISVNSKNIKNGKEIVKIKEVLEQIDMLQKYLTVETADNDGKVLERIITMKDVLKYISETNSNIKDLMESYRSLKETPGMENIPPAVIKEIKTVKDSNEKTLGIMERVMSTVQEIREDLNICMAVLLEQGFIEETYEDESDEESEITDSDSDEKNETK